MWTKGRSGNPGGRPKGLAKEVRERFGGESGIAETLRLIFEGKHSLITSERYRWEALMIALERGWGKVPEVADPFEGMTDDELRDAWKRAQERMDSVVIEDTQ